MPALNAWFDGDNLTRTLHPHVDIGIAVDTDDGLFVPALRNADMLDAAGVRARDQAPARAGRGPQHPGVGAVAATRSRCPTSACSPAATRRRWWCRRRVAIVGAGKLRHDVVAVMGGIEVHRRMPLSLTFDHRAATGGEAARFLKAMLDDLRVRMTARVRCAVRIASKLRRPMAHRSRLAGFIIDCQTDDLDAAADVLERCARHCRSPIATRATATPNTSMFGNTPADLHIEVQKVAASLARAPGHRDRRPRRGSRAARGARREEDRVREALVGDGSPDRAALLRRQDEASGQAHSRTSGRDSGCKEPVGRRHSTRRGYLRESGLTSARRRAAQKAQAS